MARAQATPAGRSLARRQLITPNLALLRSLYFHQDKIDPHKRLTITRFGINVLRPQKTTRAVFSTAYSSARIGQIDQIDHDLENLYHVLDQIDHDLDHPSRS